MKHMNKCDIFMLIAFIEFLICLIFTLQYIQIRGVEIEGNPIVRFLFSYDLAFGTVILFVLWLATFFGWSEARIKYPRLAKVFAIIYLIIFTIAVINDFLKFGYIYVL
ncbi:MAG: hypothetical protein J7J38_02965 [Candidatus Aenigmarchaeota archaeon]|nr:hypothetical protein [Candidatus Aenigmarchaeota archaeon]